MEFDDFARVIGYLTIGWWILMVILVLIIFVIGKSMFARETLAGFISPTHHRGGCRRANGTPCQS